ncbi:Hypothetical protein SMAX5B_017051, partial [Scophthalmus maximus]
HKHNPKNNNGQESTYMALQPQLPSMLVLGIERRDVTPHRGRQIGVGKPVSMYLARGSLERPPCLILPPTLCVL